jgi:hypothetical protein
MKRIFTLFAALILSHVAYAQIDGSYNNSVAIQAFGVVQVPKILNQSNQNKYISTYLNSVMVKFNDNQISYRLSGSYFKEDISINDADQTRGKITDYTFKVGFEKNFNYSYLQPYFLMDIGYRSNEFDGTVNQNTLTTVARNGATVSPGFGIKINALKALTFYAEGNVEFYYFQSKDDTSFSGAEARTTNKYYKSQLLLNPISAGIQFHFGSNN